MKKILLAVSAILLFSSSAYSMSYTFSYGGYDWGTMTLEQFDNNSISVRYDASNTIPDRSEATGFGFAPDLGTFTISNPVDGTFLWDDNGLDWIKLLNLSSIPNPANSVVYDKDDFIFGATEENSNNFSPPGILKGKSDLFYLDFVKNTLVSDITLVGVRLQSLPDTINTGSLFLVGTPPNNEVPEPATMLLFGTGLAGLAGVVRRKKK